MLCVASTSCTGLKPANGSHALPRPALRAAGPRLGRALRALEDSDKELDAQLLEDLQRLRQRQGVASGSPSPAVGDAQQEVPVGALAGAKDAIEKVLIADFFFVLFALGWLGAGLAERSAIGSTALLDSWFPLWQWVFQPAIGVLMLGALASGAAGWAAENVAKR